MFRTVAAVLLLLLVAGAASAFWPFSSTISSGQPPPAAAGNPVEIAAVPVSRIFVSGFVPTSRIQNELEAITPKTKSGSKDDPVGDPIVEDVLTWSVNRSPISVATGDGKIVASTTMSGTARISGKARLIRGDLGKLLRKLTPKTSIPFGAHADLGANASIESQPLLQPDWRLAPNLAVSLDLFKAQIPVKHFGTISAHNLVRSELDNTVTALQKRLNDRIRNDDFIENAARQAQADLCKVHAFEAGDDRQGWLVVAPQAWEATQPKIDASGLRLGLGLRAHTAISFDDKPAEPDCGFPDSVEIPEGQTEPRFTLAIPAILPWDQLSATISAELSGKVFDTEGAGHTISISPQSLHLAPYGDRILATIDFSGKVSGLFGARFDGRVYLTARPALKRDTQILRFDAVDVSVESRQALSATGIFGTLAAPLLESLIVNTAAIDLSKEAERAISAAGNAMQALNNDRLRQHGIMLEGTVDTITLDHIRIAEDALYVRLSAIGTLSVNVDSLLRE